MVSTWFDLLLLSATCLLQSTHAQSGSTSDLKVQVDLVFPKNNTEYKPTNPFPIVFALHGFAAAWSSKPVLQWSLIDLSYRRTTAGGGYIGWREGLAPPSEPHFLYINSSRSAGRYNISRYELEYLFTVGFDECRGSLVGSTPANYPGRRGYINFSIDFDRGIMPDVATVGSCATPLAAVSIIGTNQTDPSCPPLKIPNPAPDACAFPVTQQVADQVAEEMTKVSGCTNGTWPLGTGIGQYCPNDKNPLDKSAALASSPSTMNLALSAITVALFLAFT